MKIFGFIYFFLLFHFLTVMQKAGAQTNYSFPISSILNSMPNGTRLPDGTIVKAKRIKINATGTHGSTSGSPGPSLGGNFDGTTLPGFVGDKTPTNFTKIETSSTLNIDNGASNNCANGIGFWIFFDRPTHYISFLGLDVDGQNGVPSGNNGNAEWISYMAYNGNTYEPYTMTFQGTKMANQAITVNATHNWRTLISDSISPAAASSLPTALNVIRATSVANTGDPDDLNNQVLFNPTDATIPITDFFFLFGIWSVTGAANTQASGISPIVVRISPDFGDAPDSYKTLLTSSGPSHGVVNSLSLGISVVTEGDGAPSPQANNSLDDNGVSNIIAIPNNRSTTQTIGTYSLTTGFNNTTGLPANFVAWIDWNNNGTFEPSEGLTSTTAAGTTSGTVTFIWNNMTLSAPLGQTHTYARIRVTTESINTNDVGGAFKDGEVEDYLIPFATIIPLQLVSFSGKMENNQATLYWKTENEINTYRFEIQHSKDGIVFLPIGTVISLDNGSHSYSFKDSSVIENRNNFYRLKMIDRDSSATFSNIINIKSEPTTNAGFKISPNPVAETLKLTAEQAMPLTIYMYNAEGKLMRMQKTNPSNYILINCTGLSKGVYHLKLVNEKGGETILQFVKQ